jgi:hypothetical protein
MRDAGLAADAEAIEGGGVKWFEDLQRCESGAEARAVQTLRAVSRAHRPARSVWTAAVHPMRNEIF